MSTLAGCASVLSSEVSAAAVTCAIISPESRPPRRVRNAGRPLSAGLTSRSERRSLIVASCATPMASRSAASATGAPWKLPPDTISPSSAKTIGLSVAALASISTTPARVGDGVARRAVHLRRAAHRVGVLHPAAVGVRVVERAAVDQPAQVGGATPLAAMRPGGVDARVERGNRAAQRVDGQRGDDVGGAGQPVGGGDGQRQHGRGGLGAVDQRQALLGGRADRREAGGASASAAGRRVVAVPDVAFADQHQRDVRQRREVAAGADRAAARHAADARRR